LACFLSCATPRPSPRLRWAILIPWSAAGQTSRNRLIILPTRLIACSEIGMCMIGTPFTTAKLVMRLEVAGGGDVRSIDFVR
jgi:hypothetical protein